MAHISPIIFAKFSKTDDMLCWQRLWGDRYVYTAGGKGEFPWEGNLSMFVRITAMCVVFHPAIREISPTMDVCDTHVSIFTAVLFSTTKKWYPKYPSVGDWWNTIWYTHTMKKTIIL